MSNETMNGGRYASWKWLVGVLVTFVVMLTAPVLYLDRMSVTRKLDSIEIQIQQMHTDISSQNNALRNDYISLRERVNLIEERQNNVLRRLDKVEEIRK